MARRAAARGAERPPSSWRTPARQPSPTQYWRLAGLPSRSLERSAGRRLAEGAGTVPTPACAGPVFETGAASLDLPAFREMAAQAGLAPAPSRITTGWTTVIPLSSGAAGRSCTCIGPFRRRVPGLLRRRQQLRMVSAAGLAPAVPWSQARDVAPTPRTEAPRWNQEGTGDLFCSRAGFSLLDRCPPPGSGGPDGICTHSLPADNGLLH